MQVEASFLGYFQRTLLRQSNSPLAFHVTGTVINSNTSIN